MSAVQDTTVEPLETLMKLKLFSLAILSSSLALAPAPAAAKGCIRGALAGGVAGHYAGHHALMGAAAGCAAGHMYYKHKANVANGTAHRWLPRHKTS